MASLKRGRDPENSPPPAPKQSKIEDYFPSQISTSNRHAILADYFDSPPRDISVDDVAGNLGQAIGMGNSEVIADNPEASIDEAETKLTDNLSLGLFSLTAKTVELIYNELRTLHLKLDSLVELMSKIVAQEPNLIKIKALPKDKPTTSLGEFSTLTTKASSAQHYHLTLQAHKACLTICSFNGKTPSWSFKDLAKRHLRTLSGVENVDLISVELLSNPNQTQNFLLSFSSPKIPGLLFRRRSSLRAKGIFPDRVFINTILTPLIPNFNKCKLNSVKCADNTKVPEEYLKTNQMDLIDLTEASEPLPPFWKSPLGHLDLEENLMGSFKELPVFEQQQITDRLEKLRSTLLKSTNDTAALPNLPTSLKFHALTDSTVTSNILQRTERPTSLTSEMEVHSSPHLGTDSFLTQRRNVNEMQPLTTLERKKHG